AIELYAPSKVTGALHAPAIFIDRGVKFEGSCKMVPLDEDGPTTLSAAGADPEAPEVPVHARGLRPAEPGSAPEPPVHARGLRPVEPGSAPEPPVTPRSGMVG